MSVFQHFKGGKYELLHMNAYDHETQERLVVYRSLDTNQVWVRPVDSFFEYVNGVPRFKEISSGTEETSQ